jgi:hypothetical protein
MIARLRIFFTAPFLPVRFVEVRLGVALCLGRFRTASAA